MILPFSGMSFPIFGSREQNRILEPFVNANLEQFRETFGLLGENF